MINLKESDETAKGMLIHKAGEIWEKITNKEITPDEALYEIDSLEEEVKILKKLNYPLSDDEKMTYAPVEMAIKGLRKSYEKM